jgi:hypothetical protein
MLLLDQTNSLILPVRRVLARDLEFSHREKIKAVDKPSSPVLVRATTCSSSPLADRVVVVDRQLLLIANSLLAHSLLMLRWGPDSLDDQQHPHPLCLMGKKQEGSCDATRQQRSRASPMFENIPTFGFARMI